jgi:nitrogen regulatory protein PII
MSKLIIFITTHTEKSLQVAEDWQTAGSPGVTLINTHGVQALMRQKRHHAPDLPFAISMAGILNQLRETNVLLFSVVDDELVDKLIDVAQRTVGDLNEPDNGIIFVLDVERVVGLRNHGAS